MEAESTKELRRILEANRNELNEKSLPVLTRSEKIHAIKPELLLIIAIIVMKIIFGLIPIILYIAGVPGFTKLVVFSVIGVLVVFDILTFADREIRDRFFKNRYRGRILNARYEKAKNTEVQ